MKLYQYVFGLGGAAALFGVVAVGNLGAQQGSVLNPGAPAEAKEPDLGKFSYAVGRQVGQMGQGKDEAYVEALIKGLKEGMEGKHEEAYLQGANVAMSLKADNIEADIDKLVEGMRSSAKGEKATMTDEEMNEQFMLMRQFQQEKVSREQLAEANAFLEKNAKRDGVKKTESGMQYEVLVEGKGEIPKPTDRVKAHYTGTLADGTPFDSSKDRGPFEFQANSGVIQGWQEAAQMMPVGSKWKLFLPPHLAYGERGSPPTIPPNAMLVFEIELLEIVK